MDAGAPAALEGGGQPHGGALLATQLRDAGRLRLEDDDGLRSEIQRVGHFKNSKKGFLGFKSGINLLSGRLKTGK